MKNIFKSIGRYAAVADAPSHTSVSVGGKSIRSFKSGLVTAWDGDTRRLA